MSSSLWKFFLIVTYTKIGKINEQTMQANAMPEFSISSGVVQKSRKSVIFPLSTKANDYKKEQKAISK